MTTIREKFLKNVVSKLQEMELPEGDAQSTFAKGGGKDQVRPQAYVRVSKATFDAAAHTLSVNGWCLSRNSDYDLFLTVPGTSIFVHIPSGTEMRADVLDVYEDFQDVAKPGWRVKLPVSSLSDGAEVHVYYVQGDQILQHHKQIEGLATQETVVKSAEEVSVCGLVLEKCEYSPLRSLGSAKLFCRGGHPEGNLQLLTNKGRRISASQVTPRWKNRGKDLVGEIRFPLAGLAAGEALQVRIGELASDFKTIVVKQDSEQRKAALSPSVLRSSNAQPGSLVLQDLIALRGLVQGRVQESVPGSICYFPRFDNSEDYSSHYYRASWYLGGGTGKVTFGLDNPSLELLAPDEDFDRDCLEPGAGFARVSDEAAFQKDLLAASLLLIWRPVSKEQIQYLQTLFPGKQILPVATADPAAAEYGSYCRAPWLLLPPQQRQKILSDSQQKFNRLLERERGKGKTIAAIFGTGPSVDRAFEFDFTHAMTVACNTIIASDELLDHLQPALITAGDAVSHFGVSRYAARYRRDLIRCLQERDAYFLTSASMGFVLANRHPEISSRLILCDQTHDGINLDLGDVWSLPRFDSTLNIHMLPAAASFADTVFLLGFDGKNPDPSANEDFWAHSRKAHYHDLVETGHGCHPTFAVNRAQATADRYLASVEESFAAGECLGKRFYTLLPSFTPGLQARPVPEHLLEQDLHSGRQVLAARQTTSAAVTGKRALIVMTSPRAHFSGGRYHASMMALSMSAFCDEVVVWSNNYIPWLNELSLSPHYDKLCFHVNDFIAPPEGRFDYVVLVPDLSDDVCKRAFLIAQRDGAQTAMVNFESPNWFNAMSPEPRPLENFRNWYAMGCFSDIILSSADTAVPFARRFYKNPFHEQVFAVARPAINDPAAQAVLSRLPARERRITVFGRFGATSKHKNLNGLLEVLPEGLEGFVMSLVAGTSNVIEPGQIQELEAALEERGIRLELLNMISDYRKFEVIAASDLVLFPSLFEGFGYPPAEAAFMGTPCVMYDLPVLLENNSDHGHFVPVNDYGAMQEKIRDLLRQPQQERLSGTERPTICAHVSQDGFSRSLQAAFEAVSQAIAATTFSGEKFLAAQKIYDDEIHLQALPYHCMTEQELKDVISFYRSKLHIIDDAMENLVARFHRSNRF